MFLSTTLDFPVILMGNLIVTLLHIREVLVGSFVGWLVGDNLVLMGFRPYIVIFMTSCLLL
jgi:hypothetical protein